MEARLLITPIVYLPGSNNATSQSRAAARRGYRRTAIKAAKRDRTIRLGLLAGMGTVFSHLFGPT